MRLVDRVELIAPYLGQNLDNLALHLRQECHVSAHFHEVEHPGQGMAQWAVEFALLGL